MQTKWNMVISCNTNGNIFLEDRAAVPYEVKYLFSMWPRNSPSRYTLREVKDSRMHSSIVADHPKLEAIK